MLMRGSRPYPPKVRRLEQLDELGINIADFVCFAPNELDVAELRRFCTKYKIVSCRTFAQDEDKEFKTPVKYEIADHDEVERFARTQNTKYFVLVNEALPLRDSVIAGNIYFNSLTDFVCEYFRGPGTPRDIDERPIQHVDAAHFGSVHELNDLPGVVSLFPYRPVIFEFSLYPYSVGKRQRRLIFWEWRKA